MPYTPSPPPKVSERLWSAEVALAEAVEGVDPLRKDDTYRFSNGRRFSESEPYAAPDLPETPA
jgi:hypothetical protein